MIVDEGSSDATCSIIEEYANNHPYVVFVKFDKNRGTNAARNEAIRKAQGKWCIILDSDDCFCETALSDIDKTIKENLRLVIMPLRLTICKIIIKTI